MEGDNCSDDCDCDDSTTVNGDCPADTCTCDGDCVYDECECELAETVLVEFSASGNGEVTAAGPGGLSFPSGLYVGRNVEITFSAGAEAGYVFSRWVVNGTDDPEMSESLSLIANRALNVVGVFVEEPEFNPTILLPDSIPNTAQGGTVDITVSVVRDGYSGALEITSQPADWITPVAIPAVAQGGSVAQNVSTVITIRVPDGASYAGAANPHSLTFIVSPVSDEYDVGIGRVSAEITVLAPDVEHELGLEIFPAGTVEIPSGGRLFVFNVDRDGYYGELTIRALTAAPGATGSVAVPWIDDMILHPLTSRYERFIAIPTPLPTIPNPVHFYVFASSESGRIQGYTETRVLTPDAAPPPGASILGMTADFIPPLVDGEIAAGTSAPIRLTVNRGGAGGYAGALEVEVVWPPTITATGGIAAGANLGDALLHVATDADLGAQTVQVRLSSPDTDGVATSTMLEFTVVEGAPGVAPNQPILTLLSTEYHGADARQGDTFSVEFLVRRNGAVGDLSIAVQTAVTGWTLTGLTIPADVNEATHTVTVALGAGAALYTASNPTTANFVLRATSGGVNTDSEPVPFTLYVRTPVPPLGAILNITDVVAPVTNATPATSPTLTATGIASVSLEWRRGSTVIANDADFTVRAVYTARITLAATDFYTFAGGFANTAQISSFTVVATTPAGMDDLTLTPTRWVSNYDGRNLVFDIDFPATTPLVIGSASATPAALVITAPATGGTPGGTTGILTGNNSDIFTGVTIRWLYEDYSDWNPVTGDFAAATTYRAIVTLIAYDTHALPAILGEIVETLAPTSLGSGSITGEADGPGTLILTITFPATAAGI